MEREFEQDLADAELIDLGEITEVTHGSPIGLVPDDNHLSFSGMGLFND